MILKEDVMLCFLFIAQETSKSLNLLLPFISCVKGGLFRKYGLQSWRERKRKKKEGSFLHNKIFQSRNRFPQNKARKLNIMMELSNQVKTY